MHPKTVLARARKAGMPAALAAALVLAATGCSTQPTDTAPSAAPAPEDPYGHVHGISADPDTGRLLLATHNGLFDATDGSPEQIGPDIDLMGFSSAGDNRFYASGHPGTGTNLPDPAGLIRSTDGGRTWKPMSRQGFSDFHALAVSRDGVVGYDGELRMTKDLQEWTTVHAGIRPYALAGTTTSAVVLATTEQGVRRSTDGGKTWDLHPSAPVLLVVAFADDATAVGITPDGTVHLSRDRGRTWQATGNVGGQPEAVAAGRGQDKNVRIWAYTANGLQYSDDNGTTFSTSRTGAGQ